MATYSDIKGQNILIVSSDPANPLEGQIWYNTTSNTLKGYQNVVTNSWASGGNLPTSIEETAGGGTQTAGIQFAGYGGSYLNVTNNYNGTTWTSAPTLSTSRSNFGGSGSQTSALAVGGQGIAPPGASVTSEQYNGSAWTAAANYPVALGSNCGLTGPGTAALMMGGQTPPYTAVVNNYNGTSWTAGTSLPSARDRNGVTGTQTTAITIGGRDPSAPPYMNKVDSYNGTAWTNVANYPAGYIGVMASGNNTDAVAFGGNTYPGPNTTSTNSWNGTAWSSLPSMSNARYQGARGNTGATSSLTYAAGGASGLSATEEWTGAALTTRTITVS